ncbi:MAG: hypothetical protein O3A46_15490, partial [Candidatus Poribacteria bacterium]|nr:hypothetical protein [Candidatus Poribacteria bacterium]
MFGWKRMALMGALAGGLVSSAAALTDAEFIDSIPMSVQEQQAGHRMTAYTGLTVIDGDPYWRIDLRPDFRFGKLGVGFKIVTLIGAPTAADGTEEDTKILTEDGEEWGNASAYLRTVRYVEWATPRAPLYARYGELFNVRVGQGLLMEGYSNYDRRGGRFNLNRESGWGLQTVINNFKEPELFGGRVYIQPLKLAGNETPLLSKLSFGATFLTDINPV